MSMNVVRLPTQEQRYAAKVQACAASLERQLEARASTYGPHVLLCALTEILAQALERIDVNRGAMIMAKLEKRRRR